MATPAQLTIPKREPGDPALDHQALFALGLEHLQRTAHRVWSDHNLHDPGITTLELLGYALTDLAYRASFPIADLLASETDDAARMREQFFTARQILPNRALTTSDYRKLLIDLKGVKNAWILPTTESYFADTVGGVLLRTRPSQMEGVVEMKVRGLYEVLVDFMDQVTTDAEREAIIRRVGETLHANRNLCEDFVGFDAVKTQDFIVCGELEVAPDADLARVHAEILFAAQEYFAPPVNQYTLAEMLERTRADGSHWGAEDLFEGPALEHGFIDDEELARAELPGELRLSDLVNEVMDLPGVRAVRDLVISPASGGALENRWRVPVTPGRSARLARERCRLVFYKRGMPSLARGDRVEEEWRRLTAEAAARVETETPFDFEIPLGTFRRPAVYYSFQNHFPAVYGLSDAGLVGLADERRQLLAYQLKGYLLFFDQLMADFFAQLSRLPDLFSTDPELERSYFHQRVDSFRDFEKIYAAADPVAAIDTAGVDDPAVQIDRRNRFLDHLIARHGERFHDFAQIMRSEFGAGPASMIRYKCEFLRDYPALGSERSLAYDHTLTGDADLWNSENVSGLERRLARLLGIRRSTRRNLGEISYDVYAEVDSTPGDEFRFRIRKRDTGKIVLSSTVHYLTEADARAGMQRALHFAMLPAGYQRRQGSDGRFYFNVVDDAGHLVGRRIEYFSTQEAMDAAIAALIEYLRVEYSEEGMYLVESILLRPRLDEPDDPTLPICPDPNCVDCAGEDPYSYRIHVILPSYGGRFQDMDFRRWAEQVIREETPAHVQPRVCWASATDIAELEKLYRDWIYLRSGRESAGRKEKLDAFIEKLYRVKSVYPAQGLRGCAAEEKFIVGRTAIGTKR